MAHSANARESYRQETGSGEHPADTARRWRKANELGESQFASLLPDLSPKAKRALGNDLQIWMLETGRTDVSLAAELSAKLQDPSYGTLSNRQINERTVGRWRSGLMVPRHPQHIALLTELSGGRVTANSFIEARDREFPVT
jgi:hypothetical protein